MIWDYGNQISNLVRDGKSREEKDEFDATILKPQEHVPALEVEKDNLEQSESCDNALMCL